MFPVRIIGFFAEILAAATFSLPSIADPILRVAPASSTVSTGDSLAIDVNISGLTDQARWRSHARNRSGHVYVHTLMRAIQSSDANCSRS